jgi:hypothetical protein
MREERHLVRGVKLDQRTERPPWLKEVLQTAICEDAPMKLRSRGSFSAFLDRQRGGISAAA